MWTHKLMANLFIEQPDWYRYEFIEHDRYLYEFIEQHDRYWYGG